MLRGPDIDAGAGEIRITGEVRILMDIAVIIAIAAAIVVTITSNNKRNKK